MVRGRTAVPDPDELELDGRAVPGAQVDVLYASTDGKTDAQGVAKLALPMTPLVPGHQVVGVVDEVGVGVDGDTRLTHGVLPRPPKRSVRGPLIRNEAP